jgi:hypothetical protein
VTTGLVPPHAGIIEKGRTESRALLSSWFPELRILLPARCIRRDRGSCRQDAKTSAGVVRRAVAA